MKRAKKRALFSFGLSHIVPVFDHIKSTESSTKIIELTSLLIKEILPV